MLLLETKLVSLIKDEGFVIISFDFARSANLQEDKQEVQSTWDVNASKETLEKKQSF